MTKTGTKNNEHFHLESKTESKIAAKINTDNDSHPDSHNESQIVIIKISAS